ncbi:MAG: MBL fold metallo-hydrolase [Olegusella sp.]|nr:MBL fold metallo-hydrolase [Olegusella sp.]
MKKIADNLYQFSMYIPPMDFTIHQYLLATDPAILFAAGTAQQAAAVLPEIREILGERPLKYVFVSHMETDEAGGVFVIRKAYPDVQVICGNLAARELPGWGYEGATVAKAGGETLQDGQLDLVFFDYPAEVHDQNGILALERNSGILYSADLFLRFGNGVGQTIKASWPDEVNAIDKQRIPVKAQREKVQAALRAVSPKLVAVGHGFCLDCE